SHRSVLLNHRIQDLLIALPRSYMGVNLSQHGFCGAARAGIGTANVIAPGGRLFAAVAHALQLGADLVGAIGLVRQQPPRARRQHRRKAEYNHCRDAGPALHTLVVPSRSTTCAGRMPLSSGAAAGTCACESTTTAARFGASATIVPITTTIPPHHT